jgi:predicted nuclease with TOPRIM domain
MRKLTILAFGLASLAACDKSKPALEQALAQVQQISAEKDSLLNDVTATSQFIAEVNAEISKVRTENSRPTSVQPTDVADNMTPSDRRARVLGKVRELTARVDASEKRLAASRARIVALTGSDSSMKTQLAAYDSTITAFKSIMDSQRAEIASLNEQVTTLTGQNTELKTTNFQLTSDKTDLTTQRDQLSGERDKLTNERNTVYYVIGTKKELEDRHIIVKTGGALGIGKTAVPARQLNPADFTSIDKTQVLEIPLPKGEAEYGILTRQDNKALEVVPDKDGNLRGSLKIKDAETFWAASKFLIVIER